MTKQTLFNLWDFYDLVRKLSKRTLKYTLSISHIINSTKPSSIHILYRQLNNLHNLLLYLTDRYYQKQPATEVAYGLECRMHQIHVMDVKSS